MIIMAMNIIAVAMMIIALTGVVALGYMLEMMKSYNKIINKSLELLKESEE